MSSWFAQTSNNDGVAIAAAAWNYCPVLGAEMLTQVEARHTWVCRGSYTISNMSFRLTANTLSGILNWSSRDTGGAGNQTADAAAGTSGLFEDAVNSDSITSGDNFNWRVGAAAGTGSATWTFTSCVITAADIPVIGTSNLGGKSISFGVTNYTTIGGITMEMNAIEGAALITLRKNTTLSHMYFYSYSYSLDAGVVVKLRVDAADGNQVVTINGTGAFEDGVNSDIIAAGSQVCYEWDSTASSAGSVKCSVSTIISACSARQGMTTYAVSAVMNDGYIDYFCIEGAANIMAVEANLQAEVNCSMVCQNFFVAIAVNTLNAITTYKLRVDGGDGNTGISVPAAATGYFEDLGNSDNVVAATLIDFECDTMASGSGSLNQLTISVEMDQPAGGGGNAGNKTGAGVVTAGAARLLLD